MKKIIESYTDSLLELLYPEKNYCLVCGVHDKSIGENYICSSCRKKLIYNSDPLCEICGKSMLIENELHICKQCSKQNYSFVKNKSIFEYKGLIKKILHAYKYEDKPYYYKLLATELCNFMIENSYLNFDLITSVPIHKSKMKSRGYNQAELLAKFISEKLEIPYYELLVRKENTIKQSALLKEERQKNLIKAFAISGKIDYNIVSNKSVLIIDDIYTTGSTMNFCSKALHDVGAKYIYGLTVAR